jgi:hypothetical protein
MAGKEVCACSVQVHGAGGGEVGRWGGGAPPNTFDVRLVEFRYRTCGHRGQLFI